MSLVIVNNKVRLCATCMNWATNLRKMSEGRQHIIYECNNKARCEASNGEFVGVSTNSSQKCREWRVCRKMRPVPSNLVESFKRFAEDEKQKKTASSTGTAKKEDTSG